jgi:hypothetical protein
MNSKKMKKINHRSIEIFTEWLADQLPSSEIEKITKKNIQDFIPKQQYYYDRGSRLSKASPKGIRKKIKKHVRLGVAIKDVNRNMVDV